MGVLGWILLGLVAGAIARALQPGPSQLRGCLGTTALGVVGALVGGALASAAGFGKVSSFFSARSWLIAIAGSLLVLMVFSLAERRRM